MYFTLAFLKEVIKPADVVLGTVKVPEVIQHVILNSPHPGIAWVHHDMLETGEEFIACSLNISDWGSGEYAWLYHSHPNSTYFVFPEAVGMGPADVENAVREAKWFLQLKAELRRDNPCTSN